jgi:hypothetical protein
MKSSNNDQTVKYAALTNAGKDDGQFPSSQVIYNQRVADFYVVYPYGMSANAPADSLVVMMNMMGQEENRAGIASLPYQRFKDLKVGEVAFGNFLTRSHVIFKEDGSVEIVSEDNLNIEVKGPLANITCTGVINLTAPIVNLATLVNLGTGGPAIARVGDQVQIGDDIGTIITGSSNHTAD